MRLCYSAFPFSCKRIFSTDSVACSFFFIFNVGSLHFLGFCGELSETLELNSFCFAPEVRIRSKKKNHVFFFLFILAFLFFEFVFAVIVVGF